MRGLFRWLGRSAFNCGSAYLISAASLVAIGATGLPIMLAFLPPALFAIDAARRSPTQLEGLSSLAILGAIGFSALPPSGAGALFAAATATFGAMVEGASRRNARTRNPARPVVQKTDCPHIDYPGAQAPSDFPNCQFISGTKFTPIATLWEERWTAAIRVAATEPLFPMGGVPFTLPEVAEGGIVVGNSGSGKTLTLLGVVSALAPHLLTAIYDHKRTLYSAMAAAMPLGESQIALLNPADLRGRCWALGSDITSWLSAITFSNAIAQNAQEEVDYWVRESKVGIAALIMSLIAIFGTEWSLLTLILAAHPAHVREFLKRSPEGRMFIETALSSQSRMGDRPGDILATLFSMVSNLLPYALAAEIHFRAGRRISIRDWAQERTEERCLLFANHPVYEGAFAPMNRAICAFVSAQLLGLPGRYPVPRALVVIDELQAAKGLPVEELLTNGREKGVSTWLATQHLSGLSASLKSRDAADSVLGGVRAQVFLITSDLATAERASDLCGTQTFLRTLMSRSGSTSDTRTGGENGRSRSIADTEGWSSSPSVVTEKLLPPHVLRTLPPPGPSTGLTGLFVRDGKIWMPTLDWNFVLAQLPPRPDDVPDEVPVDLEAIPFSPWTQEDVSALLAGEDDDGRFLSDPPEGQE